MRIEYLADHPHLISQLAGLHYEQWGYLRPNETLAQRTRRLRVACGRGGVPSAVAALADDGSLLGSAMLIANDMATRPELTPWLAGVYVLDAYRDQGIGSALVKRIEAEAASTGAKRLHLYTPNAARFYARLGWSTDERYTYLGQRVTLMSKRLGPARDSI